VRFDNVFIMYKIFIIYLWHFIVSCHVDIVVIVGIKSSLIMINASLVVRVCHHWYVIWCVTCLVQIGHLVTKTWSHMLWLTNRFP